MAGSTTRVRGARRQDIPLLVDLRVQYLAEMGRMEPRFHLLPDVRQRTEQALPVWIDQEDRLLLVAEGAEPEGAGVALLGYATGLVTIWPPVFKNQHVGEVSEVYVAPEQRGTGVGRELLAALTQALRERGGQVLRAPVPMRSEANLARFRALGYRPLHYVLEKSLEES